MRKIILASAITLSTIAVAQKNETIEGNGKLVTRNVDVKSFTELKASGVYELKLTQGNKEEVRIEADENLQAYFTIKNEGNKLVINMEKMKNKNLKNKGKMKVYVTFKKLNDIELSTVGSVSTENTLAFDDLEFSNNSVGNVTFAFTANKLDLKNSSVGDVKLSGKAKQAVVKNSGVGNLNAGDFIVQTMDIENNGVGGAEVNATKDLKVKDSFLGKVKNKGAAQAKKSKKVYI